MKRNVPIVAMFSLILINFMPVSLSAQPRPIEILNQSPDIGGDWYDNGKTVFEYPSEVQTIQTEYGWIPPNWETFNRTISTVDEHGNLTEYILEMPSEGDWTQVVHWLYINTYDNDRLMEVKLGSPGLVELGIFTSRDVYSYDESGKLTQVTHQLAVFGWVDIGRTVYHYQGNDIDYVTEEDYDEASSSWQYTEKTVHTYSGGKLFSLEEFVYDQDDWDREVMLEYYYNADESINYILERLWDDTVYEIRRRYLYSYAGTSVSQLSSSLPESFSLSNYPNPFNAETTIQFSIQAAAPVNLDIFDILGRKVRSLVAGEFREAGAYQLKWDGRDDAGQIQPSGTYIYQLSTDSHTISKSCLLIK